MPAMGYHPRAKGSTPAEKKDGKDKKEKAPRAAAGEKRPRQTARRVKRAEAARGAIEAGTAKLDEGGLPDEARPLVAAITAQGGALLGAFRDPLAGKPLLLASLPLDKVDPTPYQRQVSPAHVERLADAITKTGVYLDPIVAFWDSAAGRFHTPNGGHRSEAMRRIGARAVTALVVPDAAIAFRILALNTEKAHNLKERSTEVAGMARALLPLGGRETDYAPYFEEAALLTLGLAYGKRPRLSGAVWFPVARRLETFSEKPLGEALELREAHADELLALDDQVTTIVDALKSRGFSSPYLRTFVVARINPLRWAAIAARKAKAKDKSAETPPPPSWDATLEKMRKSAAKFDPARIEESDIAATGGAPPDED